MGKFDNFTSYLEQGASQYEFTFEEIEEIIDSKLKESAYKWSAYWSNGSQSSFASSWLKAGYVQDKCDLKKQVVSFKRDKASADAYLQKAKSNNAIIPNYHKYDMEINTEDKKANDIIVHPDQLYVQTDAIMCDELISKGEFYYQDTIKDKHSRYLSWEHCYLYFQQNHIQPNEKTIDNLCLHLAWYLASWGMLHNSFLLQKDYKIHTSIVKILTSSKYEKLYSLSIDELLNPLIINDIVCLYNDIISQFELIINNKTPTSTLVTKILLGTLGCTPAYDRYFKKGLKNGKIACQNFGVESMSQIVAYYASNLDKFEALRNKINLMASVDYPPMKIVDMCIWQFGIKL